VLWERLYRLKQRGVTLVLTTHYMDEAEQLCDRLVVMDKGRIAAEGSPRELIRDWATREVCELRFLLGEGQPGPEAYLAQLQPVVDGGAAARLEPLADRLLLYADDGDAALSAALAAGVRPVSTLVRRSSLEDVFLRLTGRTLVD
jgi:lipooligosaccharide transport system ATP-binding protein